MALFLSEVRKMDFVFSSRRQPTVVASGLVVLTFHLLKLLEMDTGPSVIHQIPFRSHKWLSHPVWQM